MTESIAQKEVVADYAFRFDALPERVTFSNQIKITGWLLHRQGLPIYGIRGIVRGILRRRSSFRARRKRSRPLIAAAYPDLPEAGQSGFLLLVELPVGRSEITIQVQDHRKTWRTIFITEVWAFPLTFLGRIGLPRVERFLSTYLAQVFVGNRQNSVSSAKPHSLSQLEGSLAREGLQSFSGELGLTQCDVRAVDLFVTSKSNLFIREIADLLCAGFRAAGCEARLLIDQIPAEKTEESKIQIVVTPHEFFNLFLRDKLPWEKMQRLTNHLFLLGTEQPESEWFDSNLIVAPHARAMLDIHLSGVAAYRARGLPCFHLPLGYHPLLEQSDVPAKSKRDLDICVLAAMTERREEFIAANADFFAARNCHIRFVPIGFAKTEDTRSYLPIPQRNALLQRAKILLNVHYSDLRYFEWHRALIAMANRCCLISETCEGFAPLVPGKHFVMAKAENLTACCEYYLEHEDERKAITAAAYDFISEHFTEAQNCRTFLQQIQTVFRRQSDVADSNFDRAASPEQAVASEPLPDALAKHLMRRPTALFLSAVYEDLSNLFHRAHTEPVPNGRTSTDPIETARRIAIVSDLRRGYIDRFEAQRKSQEQEKAIFQLIDNSRFNGSAPAISVIVTLYNYGVYIGQCLKSLEDSKTGAIPGGIEAVIVNDASTDNSLKQAMAWQRISRHPVRIIDKQLNTGLADARNLGLRLARAPYAFILDADNMLFPRALEQLHATIVRDNSAAAYSVLCRFQGAHNDREGLLSYYDWDPQMLIEYPYIDAMAMFDREQLIKIGGYDTELYKYGWFGWEDYDLWLRIAQADLRVSFLPNVLCLYRHHEKAMSNTTNLFERELVARLLEKYGSLVETYPPKRRLLGVDRSWFEGAVETSTQKRERAGV
ncbi:MAG TPA: glycosyltransferase [Candidatus Sulfotelmatobacter sp.]|jgi:glycosyltransferase involved in cell wall biosynthesis|nr:glycosyltransferase [Candidatus Sulfotelmatobacter sp.]